MSLTPTQQKLLSLTGDFAETSQQVKQAFSVEKFDMSALTTPQIHALMQRLSVEVQTRALEEMDPDALLGYVWENMFSASGAALPPIIMNGILLCAGHRIVKSGTTHTCAFVNINDTWCWEYGDLVAEPTIRGYPNRPEGSLQSAALISVKEGDRVAMLPCNASMGKHKLIKTQARYYEVRGGELEPSYSYEVKTEGHSH